MNRPLLKRTIISVVYLCVLIIFILAATNTYKSNFQQFRDEILDKWLPVGLSIMFILGFVPYVLATFFHEKFAWIPIPIMIALACLFLIYNDEMVRQVSWTLFTFHVMGFGVGVFVHSFKWRVA